MMGLLALFLLSGKLYRYKLINKELMKKKIAVTCECEGTGFVAVADSGGDGIDHVECRQHHPAFQDAPTVDELLAHIGQALAASSLTAGLMREGNEK
jgi:hypothetical protein